MNSQKPDQRIEQMKRIDIDERRYERARAEKPENIENTTQYIHEWFPELSEPERNAIYERMILQSSLDEIIELGSDNSIQLHDGCQNIIEKYGDPENESTQAIVNYYIPSIDSILAQEFILITRLLKETANYPTMRRLLEVGVEIFPQEQSLRAKLESVNHFIDKVNLSLAWVPEEEADSLLFQIIELKRQVDRLNDLALEVPKDTQVAMNLALVTQELEKKQILAKEYLEDLREMINDYRNNNNPLFELLLLQHIFALHENVGNFLDETTVTLYRRRIGELTQIVGVNPVTTYLEILEGRKELMQQYTEKKDIAMQEGRFRDARRYLNGLLYLIGMADPKRTFGLTISINPQILNLCGTEDENEKLASLLRGELQQARELTKHQEMAKALIDEIWVQLEAGNISEAEVLVSSIERYDIRGETHLLSLRIKEAVQKVVLGEITVYDVKRMKEELIKEPSK